METIKVKLPDKKSSSQKIFLELMVKEDSDPQLEFWKQKASNYPSNEVSLFEGIKNSFSKFLFYKKEQTALSTN